MTDTKEKIYIIAIIILIILLIITNVEVKKFEKKPRTETYLGEVSVYEICDYRLKIFITTLHPTFPEDYIYECWKEYKK